MEHTDTIGLLLAVPVTVASARNSTAGTRFLDRVAAGRPRIRKVWSDRVKHSSMSSGAVPVSA
ncbi:hypothetical protein ACWC3X_40020 [Streptomyces populi]